MDAFSKDSVAPQSEGNDISEFMAPDHDNEVFAGITACEDFPEEIYDQEPAEGGEEYFEEGVSYLEDDDDDDYNIFGGDHYDPYGNHTLNEWEDDDGETWYEDDYGHTYTEDMGPPCNWPDWD